MCTTYYKVKTVHVFVIISKSVYDHWWLYCIVVSFRVDGLHAIIVTDREGVPVLKGYVPMSLFRHSLTLHFMWTQCVEHIKYLLNILWLRISLNMKPNVWCTDLHCTSSVCDHILLNMLYLADSLAFLKVLLKWTRT